jgi:hypothetical protein
MLRIPARLMDLDLRLRDLESLGKWSWSCSKGREASQGPGVEQHRLSVWLRNVLLNKHVELSGCVKMVNSHEDSASPT